MIFSNRKDAAEHLAHYLAEQRISRPDIVLGLPRGGVPIAHAIAEYLKIPMDVFVVRKIGMPHHEELAIGAIGPNYKPIFSPSFIRFNRLHIDEVNEVVVKESQELDRRIKKYREGRSALNIRDKNVLLVDDGLATGSTMVAACISAREMGAEVVDVAVPVASREAVERVAEKADHVYFLETPEPFFSVGQWYYDFSQTTDEEVLQCLHP